MSNLLARRFLMALTAIAISVQCVFSPSVAAPPSSGLPQADPAQVGMDPAPLAQIAPAMQQSVNDGEAGGVVTLLARQGRVVHIEAVGYADVESKRPMRTDTIFAIASMSKPITATAVMVLADEGKLKVDDPVAQYLPEFADAALESGKPNRPITLRDLMTHTSGLTGSQQNEGTLAETVKKLAARKLQSQPGEKWQYSPGLSVCGRVVEVVSGQPFERFLQDRIFGPLEMVDTTFFPTPEQQTRIAKLYKPGAAKGTLEATTHWLSDLTPDRTPNPSGGLFSTAPDMVRFYQMVLNRGELDGKRIVSEAAVREMSTIHTGELTAGFTPSCGWGLGWGIVDKPEDVTRMLSPGTFGHGGAFGTQGWIDPERRMIFVLMIQRSGFGNGDRSPIREKFQELAVKAVKE
ncbi:MAG: beta-lactamase family protein [Pirellulales bacterium]|nr:beta-lactamase family protein [Pirellulales bacterium]